VTACQAFLFGLLLSLAGGLYLFIAVNVLTALLAITTLLSYLLIYTPLKRKTPLCTLLGAIPGAMPTLIGWSGASASVGPRAWLLFTILFLWQFPHFLAIALMYREDYSRAGYQMLPDFDADGHFTRAEIVLFAVVLVIITIVPTLGRNISLMYPLAMAVAGVFFLYYIGRLAIHHSRTSASRVVHASVIYLPVVLSVMIFCRS
jgi:protoheme IX farnesyltransferase